MANLRPKHQAIPEPSGETVKLIRQTRQSTQKRYTAEEKMRIVMEGIRGEISISALCRREHIHCNLYYRWLKEFMEAGKLRLKGDDETESRSRLRGFWRELLRLLEAGPICLGKGVRHAPARHFRPPGRLLHSPRRR